MMGGQPGLIRGAQAIADYLSGQIVCGKPISRAACYRLIEDGRIPVTRLGKKKSEVWARKSDLDGLFAPDRVAA